MRTFHFTETVYIVKETVLTKLQESLDGTGTIELTVTIYYQLGQL